VKSEKPNARDHLRDTIVDGKVTFISISGKKGETAWTGFIWLIIGTAGGLF
jgi:hypothetical protein